MGARPAWAWVALLAAALAIGGCNRSSDPLDVLGELEPVPYPSLVGAEAGVQAQVEERQRALEGLLADRDASANREALAESFGELGLVYVVYDFPDAGSTCFDNARLLSPADYRWAYLGGYVRKLKGDLKGAVPLLENSLVLEPTFLPALLRLGRSFFELGRTEDAKARFETAIGVDPGAPAAHEGLGKIAAAEGQNEQALGYFHRALELAPSASSLHYALAQAYRDLGRLDDARHQLELSGDAVVPIPDPLISPLALLGESVQLYMVQATEALDDRNYEVAAAAYKKVLEKDPQNFIGYKGRAYALEKLGDLEGALVSLRAGLERASTGVEKKDVVERAELHRILGGLEALNGRDDAAIRHFSLSLELVEDQPGVQMKLANALARQSRFGEALPYFDRLIESEPELAAAILLRRATALVNLGRGEDAFADFERALELEPDNAQIRSRYAEALDHLGERRRAKAERARVADGADIAVRVRTAAERGNRAVRSGRFEEALAAYTEALAIDSQVPDIHHRRGAVLAQLGRLDEAVAAFRAAIDLDPRHAAARHGEITSLILLERYGESRVRLNEALRIFSLDARLAHIQARLLATCPIERVRDGRIAAEVARRLVEARGDLRSRETLALALAATGDFDRAIEMQTRLVAEAEHTAEPELAADFRVKLETLKRRLPWSADGPQEILTAALGGP